MKQEPTTIFGRVARWVLRNKRLTQALLVLASALSIAAITQITVDSDLLHLMPPDEPTIAGLHELERLEAGVSLVTVSVSGEVEARGQFLRDLRDQLQDDERFRYLLFDIEPDLEWRLGALTLAPDELSSISERLDGALALGPAAANPFVAGRLLDLGPMTEKLRDAGGPRAGILDSEEVSRLLIRPNSSAHDMPFARAVMATLDEAIESLDAESRGVRVLWIGGAFRHNVEDYEGIFHDMKWTSVCSLVLVLGFITLAFRDPRAVALIFTPLLLATLWTFGFVAVSVGVLNTFTSFFGAILLGLGIDFSIHLYTRYREERANSESLEEAVVRAWDRVGPPCLAAAITTAGGFSALMFARFDGFSQLGGILAVGVVTCLVGVLVVLPLMIQWREQQPTRRRREPVILISERPPTYRFAPVALLLACSVPVVAGFLVPRIGFEYDLSELRRDGMAFGDLDEEQQRLAKESYSPVVVTYDTIEALDAGLTRHKARLEEGAMPEISRLVSVRSILPADQPARLEGLAAIAEQTRHENFRYLPAAVRKNLGRLAEEELRPLSPEDLPYGLQHILGVTGDTYRLLMVPSGNMWDLRETSELTHRVLEEVDDAPVAGEYLAIGTLFDLIQSDIPRVGFAAILLVCLGTLLDLRRPLQAIGAIFVLLSGMVWAGGAISVVGIKFSIMNITGIPILMGIGVDVVIHLLHRISEEGPGKVLKALSTTGYAAVLSSTTTILSFASLTMAGAGGVRSFGLLVLVGLATVTVSAFALLPVGWMSYWKIGGELPEE